MSETCEAGAFRACGAAVTRKCRCCGLWLCAVHHHALAEAERTGEDYTPTADETSYETAPVHMAAQRDAEVRAAQRDAEVRASGVEQAIEDITNEEAYAAQEAEARLSKCKFCGQDVAEGAGGHTSGCYERKLNKVRAALEIDEVTP